MMLKVCKLCGAQKGKVHVDDDCVVTDVADAIPANHYVEVRSRKGPCRHGTVFWCSDCLNECYSLHSAISRQDGLKEALKFVQQKAGELFVSNKMDEANLMRSVSNAITTFMKKAQEDEEAVRRKMYPEKYDSELEK